MKRTIRLTESDLRKVIKESVKKILKEANTPLIPDADIYSVSHDNRRGTVIKVWGYFYKSEYGVSLVEFTGLDFTLDEYQNGGENFVEDLEANVKQFQEDFEDPQEAYEAFMSFGTKPLLMSQVDETTPEGFYIDC